MHVVQSCQQTEQVFRREVLLRFLNEQPVRDHPDEPVTPLEGLLLGLPGCPSFFDTPRTFPYLTCYDGGGKVVKNVGLVYLTGMIPLSRTVCRSVRDPIHAL